MRLGFKTKICLITSICVAAGVSSGVAFSSYLSGKFHKGMIELSKQLSSEDKAVKYHCPQNSFFYQKCLIEINSNTDKSTTKLPVKVKAYPFNLTAEIVIPDSSLFKDNLNKYKVSKLNFDVGIKGGELTFEGTSSTPIFYKLDTIVILANSYNGMIEFPLSNFNYKNLIVNLGAKESVVKFGNESWKDYTLNLTNAAYSAPVELFLRDKKDYSAPNYSHLKIDQMDIVNGDVKKAVESGNIQTYFDVQLYRRKQGNDLEANGLKFSVGEKKLGTVVIEGTNNRINHADFDLVELDGTYKIKLTGVAFNAGNNPMVDALTNIQALKKDTSNSLISDVQIKRGVMTFNGVPQEIVSNELLKLKLNVPTANEPQGALGNTPEISIDAVEQKGETK